MRRSYSLILAASIALPVAGRAAVLDVPDGYSTIQRAVDMAAPGDVIRIAPGSYHESVRIRDGRDGITLEAADAGAVPTILGTPHKSADGIRVDEGRGIVLRNLRIADAYDGVRLNHVAGAVVEHLVIENSALGIRINRGSDNVLVANHILRTRVEQGILVDGSPRVQLAENVVDSPDEEGIRVIRSAGALVRRNRVINAQSGNGISVSGSPGARVVESVVVASYRDGVRIRSSPGLVFAGNLAQDNGNVGIRIEKSPPFATVGDVLARGNAAVGNAGGAIFVEAQRCHASTCEGGTTLPTATTTTMTTVPGSSTTPSSTATSTTLRQGPLAPASWRFYVRVATTAGTPSNVLVPLRSGAAPVQVMIRGDQLAAFRIGDRVNADELVALGGDTLSRLTAAADLYLRTHSGDYPAFGSIALRWAERAL
jgi:nitrous oxidase accessory protein NosD